MLAACTPSADEQPAATPAPPWPAVPARRGPIASILTVSGETSALRTVRLAAPVNGRITVLAVQPGDRVAANAGGAGVAGRARRLHGLDVMRDGGALDPSERPMAQRLTRDLAGRDIAVQAPFAGIVAERDLQEQRARLAGALATGPRARERGQGHDRRRRQPPTRDLGRSLHASSHQRRAPISCRSPFRTDADQKSGIFGTLIGRSESIFSKRAIPASRYHFEQSFVV
jgi:hypothetical protein